MTRAAGEFVDRQVATNSLGRKGSDDVPLAQWQTLDNEGGLYGTFERAHGGARRGAD